MKIQNPYEDPYMIKIRQLLDQALEQYHSDDDGHKYYTLMLELYSYLDREISYMENQIEHK